MPQSKPGNSVILADLFMPVHLSLSKLIPRNIITHSSQVQLLHGTHYLYQIHLYLLSEVLYVFSYSLLYVININCTNTRVTCFVLAPCYFMYPLQLQKQAERSCPEITLIIHAIVELDYLVEPKSTYAQCLVKGSHVLYKHGKLQVT